MAGRTHLQHALPVTFGYKAAVWLGMIARHRERLAQLSPRVWSASSPARLARWRRSATRALPCTTH
jgi:argininosuccinate lyase